MNTEWKQIWVVKDFTILYFSIFLYFKFKVMMVMEKKKKGESNKQKIKIKVLSLWFLLFLNKRKLLCYGTTCTSTFQM